MIQFVTFLSQGWRSLNHLKGSLNHPKKVTKNCQAIDDCLNLSYFDSLGILMPDCAKPVPLVISCSYAPSRQLTYPTNGKGNSSSQLPLVSGRVHLLHSWCRLVKGGMHLSHEKNPRILSMSHTGCLIVILISWFMK